MLSYGSYVDGQDRPGTQWVYTVRASAMLRDFFGSVRTKRGLEQGTIAPEDAPQDVIGRCAVADQHEMEQLCSRPRGRPPSGRPPRSRPGCGWSRSSTTWCARSTTRSST